MDDTELRDAVVTELRRIAPEVETEALDDRRPLRRQVDLDSLDWLRFLVALHDRLGVDIPEADYPQLSTLADLVAYLSARR
jgi:acyl carrier protein